MKVVNILVVSNIKKLLYFRGGSNIKYVNIKFYQKIIYSKIKLLQLVVKRSEIENAI